MVKDDKAWRQNYQTPQKLLERVQQVLGYNFFDPCPVNPTFDGLSIDWKENAYINPPYRKYLPWALHGLKQPGPQIWIGNSSTDARWWHALAEASTSILFVKGRIGFIHPLTGEEEDNNDRPQTIFYRGDYPEYFADQFGDLGVLR